MANEITGLLKTAKKLVELMDKGADQLLPQQIVDVVKLHSKLAVGSAWIPVPGADVAAGAVNIWSMYARVNTKIGIPFGENVLKSIGSGVATNLASYFAMSGVASALKFIPGLGTYGGALILSASLYAITLVSGWVYLQALVLLVQRNGANIESGDLGAAVQEVLKDKATIKQFIEAAKKDYKKVKDEDNPKIEDSNQTVIDDPMSPANHPGQYYDAPRQKWVRNNLVWDPKSKSYVFR